jgi:hypothetical protein
MKKSENTELGETNEKIQRKREKEMHSDEQKKAIEKEQRQEWLHELVP